MVRKRVQRPTAIEEMLGRHQSILGRIEYNNREIGRLQYEIDTLNGENDHQRILAAGYEEVLSEIGAK